MGNSASRIAVGVIPAIANVARDNGCMQEQTFTMFVLQRRVLRQHLKLGLSFIRTMDFQSVDVNLFRRTGSPSYPKKQAMTNHELIVARESAFPDPE